MRCPENQAKTLSLVAPAKNNRLYSKAAAFNTKRHLEGILRVLAIDFATLKLVFLRGRLLEELPPRTKLGLEKLSSAF